MISFRLGIIANDRMAASFGVLAVMLLSCGACAAQSMPPEQPPLTVPPMTLDVLGGIPVGTDRESAAASDALTRLRAAFEQATRDYEVGNYQTAAESFMSAARDGRGPAGSYTRLALSQSRSASYRNAARAWYMAGMLDKGRPQLAQAAADDSSCQQDIAQILKLLDAR